jgi:hypothetical protein
MPFKSEAQRRLFWAKVGRGEISRETAEKWEAHTPNKDELPMHVKEKTALDILTESFFNELQKIADMSGALGGLTERVGVRAMEGLGATQTPNIRRAASYVAGSAAPARGAKQIATAVKPTPVHMGMGAPPSM